MSYTRTGLVIPGISLDRAMSCGSGISAIVIRVTPGIAAQWLEHHQRKNRKISDNVVTRYIRVMGANNWLLNGETIVFSNKGLLMNGQHRLTACVQSGHSFRVLVIVGVEDSDEMMASYDGGMVRTGGQVLHFAGHPYADALSSMGDVVYRYENGLATSVKVDNVARLQVISKHPGMVEYAHLSKQIGTRFKRFPSTMYCGLHYLFTLSDAKQAERFTQQFMDGLGLEVGQPVAALRRAAERASQERGRMGTMIWLQMIVKAWNATINGENIRVIKIGYRESRSPDIQGLPRAVQVEEAPVENVPRPVVHRARASAPRATGQPPTAAEVRLWALTAGYDVRASGTIPNEVASAYQAAHAS